MAVYFIRAGEDGLVKIGFAVDPMKRIAFLQTACPEPLSVLRLIEGTRETEAEMHKRFSGHRVRGEWFAFTKDMLAAGEPWTGDLPRQNAGFDALILECARTHGVGKSALKHWRVRGVPHKFRWRVALTAQERGLPVPSFSALRSAA